MQVKDSNISDRICASFSKTLTIELRKKHVDELNTFYHFMF